MTEKGTKDAKKNSVFDRFDRIHRRDHEKMISIEEAYKILKKKKEVLSTPIPKTRSSLSLSSKRTRAETPVHLVSILDDYPTENLPPSSASINPPPPPSLRPPIVKNGITSENQRKYVKVKKPLTADPKRVTIIAKSIPKIEKIPSTTRANPTTKLSEVSLKRKASERNPIAPKTLQNVKTTKETKEKEKKKLIQIKE